MTLEKITSWIWRNPMTGTRSEDAYWTDGTHLIVAREGQRPEDSTEKMDIASYVMPSYEAKGRAALTEHGKAAYDYLKARGF